MSADLFAKLIGKVPSSDFSDSGNRWIARESDEDASFLASASVQALKLGRHLGVVAMRQDDRDIIALYGLGSASEKFVDGLDNVASSPALFQLSVSELDLFPNAPEGKIRDVIERRSDKYPPYGGHDLAEIEALFEPLTFWKRDTNYEYTSDINRVAGTSICRLNFASPLMQPGKLIEEFDNTFLAGDAHIPFDIVLQALLASFWQTQFVEIYRCVEQLFPAEKLLSLRDRMRSKRKLSQINRFLAETIGWRPQEDQAIKSLFSVASRDVIEDFRVAFNLKSDTPDIRNVISSEVYRTRNSVVHYRGKAGQKALGMDEWAALNDAMLKFTRELYDRFSVSFF